MEFYLDKVGVVSDSHFKIDGLTVITGRNNSGKTTIGKTLYSIISSVENLQANAFNDKKTYAISVMRKSLETLELYRFYRMHGDMLLGDKSNLDKVAYGEMEEITNIVELIVFIRNLQNDISELTTDYIINRFYSEYREHISTRIKERVNEIERKKPMAIKMLDSLLSILQSDEKLVGYTNTRIIRTLKNEFYGQIQPVRLENVGESVIKLSDKKTSYYSVKIKNNDLSNNSEIFFSSAFSNAIFINNTRVFDDMTSYADVIKRGRMHRFAPGSSYNDFLAGMSCPTKEYNLLVNLLREGNNIFEETIYNEKTLAIFDLMKNIISDEICFKEGKFVTTSDNLDIRNLATGSKMFAMIILLLRNGSLNEGSLLILDEPETHLHPTWQNIFAEVIILLIKQLGIKVLMTTHSPNFLLALEVFSIKHNIINGTHFYLSEKLEDDYMVKFKCVDGHVEEAYALMSKPFLEMDALRSQELMSNNEDSD